MADAEEVDHDVARSADGDTEAPPAHVQHDAHPLHTRSLTSNNNTDTAPEATESPSSPPPPLPLPHQQTLESNVQTPDLSTPVSPVPPVTITSPTHHPENISTSHVDRPSSSARRPRSDSQSTSATTDTTRSSARSSLVFVVGALETIAASKDAQRRKELQDLTRLALDTVKAKQDPHQIDPRILFEPLKLATEASTELVVTTALDCIGKLISYSYFSTPSAQASNTQPESLIDQAIDTICDCFDGDATPDRIQLQIIISLLAAVLNDKVVVHGAGLLKAVRQMYNIFLHSKSTRNQQVAQGTLSQMVGTVFERARSRLIAKEARLNLSKLNANPSTTSIDERLDGDPTAESSAADVGKLYDIDADADTVEDVVEEPRDVPAEKEAGAKLTLQAFERRGSFDEERLKEGPTMVTRVRARQTSNNSPSANGVESELSDEDEEDEVYMKDAFLVFRAMCKISIKSLRPDEIVDMKSQGMRSKLLSLHIIHTVLFNNTILFLSPLATIRSSTNNEATPFTQAVKQLLCQSLSRNGASTAMRVYEVGCEIFWLMLKNLRVLLKKEVEVFLKEIYLTILENRNAPIFQKQYFMNVVERITADPVVLVEIYLNYDCDRTATDNMFQRIIEHLARISITPVSITSIQQQAYQTQHANKISLADWQTKGTVPPSLATAAVSSTTEQDTGFPAEYALKQQALECLVQTLRSLVRWAQQGRLINGNDVEVHPSGEYPRESSDVRQVNGLNSAGTETPPVGLSLAEDDPNQLEKAKQHKTALLNAVRAFNFKPKRGIKVLIEGGFIKSKNPEDIARFLLTNDRLDKAAIGEYLGEGEQENINIMHAFVDSMEFTKTRFVDALRTFLQSFRLPGEAQKIDRFMLKFAERYVNGNPDAFANADTAYVLAYSVIMLNTDQHSAKLKGKRMTPEDFVKNNRGINDNADLPDEYLQGIYDEIAHNEIVLNTERETAANLGLAVQQAPVGFAANLGQAFATVGRDLQREAYVQKSEEIADKTEQLFKQLLRAQRKNATLTPTVKFIPASSTKHAGPMFEVTWTPFLTSLSGCAQETNNLETVKLCMEGLKLAVQIACLFDLEDPRTAFVASIARFTNLYNLSEMKAKNLEALRVLLDVAYSEGDTLNESWRDILTCVSQLDRFQLISEGVDEKSLPDVMKVQPTPPKGSRAAPRNALRAPLRSGRSAGFSADIAEESKSSEIVKAVDRIFLSTSRLSGEAIVQFVRALTQVSLQEIQSSGQSQEPRTYSLQKLVEVSEYNMNRVRFEWTNIWQVLGEHFNQVGCHNNTKVVHFALNSLRQLAIRFLDLEELPGFQFQKDFLKPFEHIIGNTSVVQVKEIVILSLVQLMQARGDNIRSGWKTIFGVFTVAARERFEAVVNLAYENVNGIFNNRFGMLISQGAFADSVVCLTEFSKNSRFQKKSLQAIEALKSTIPRLLKTPECPLSINPTASAVTKSSRQTQEEQYWFPILFAFHDVLMTGDDLEVRSRALNYLFDTLTRYGKDFPRDFWNTIWRQLLYPIFMVLKSKSEMTKAVNHEEMSVWLSTTMIQALRNMVSLFTHYFNSLEYMLDRFLDLLALCICQENDTLARIGSNCLQTLILQNVDKFTPVHWEKIVTAFVDLFTRTEATALFAAAASSFSSAPSEASAGQALGNGSANSLPLSDRSRSLKPQVSRTTSEQSMNSEVQSPSDSNTTVSPTQEIKAPFEDYRPPSQLQQAPVVVTAARRRFFNQIITKCVLQLLMIETVNELFSNDHVYERIPSMELLRLMGLLKKSYHFAKRFNDDLDLRNRLFQEGFMKQPPNLLKQESGSASVYVNILFRMYHDEGEERRSSRQQTEAALIPLCVDIIVSYLQLKEETQQRNIVTWRPVVIDVIEGYVNFPDDGFEKHSSTFAPLLAPLMNREMGMDLQRAVQALLYRILELHYELPALDVSTPVLTSPRPSVFGSRRASRASNPR